MADHLAGDALAELAVRLRVKGQRPIGMRVDVDKPGRDDPFGGVNNMIGLHGDLLVDGGDSPVFNQDIGEAAGLPGAIHNGAVLNKDCWHSLHLSRICLGPPVDPPTRR